ncbi:MAG: T9SS type A sorting domain-containing protein [Bacteroidota bacterium]
MKRIIFYIALLLTSTQIWAQSVTINESVGWLESAFVKWAPVSGANSYNVYYTGGGQTNKRIDTQLIRSYGSYFRADVPGLAAGTYTLKVVPVTNGSENTSAASTTASLIVKPHIREGFAFSNNVVPGAYNADGTPKSGAKIIYITSNTVNTVTSSVLNDKGVAVPATGLMNILFARSKGYDSTPLIIRMIGLIKGNQITGLKDGNFIDFTGSNNTTRKTSNITFEGIGDDATAHGYGFAVKRSKSIEIRNVGVMLYGDDAVSMDTDNANIWVHNNDFFYGAPGSDADQVKGDGTIDMKYNSSNITISYNHFWDSGKAMGSGGPTETVPTLYISYHHNWFDHIDSRSPRLHYITAHVYNNYFDGLAVYGIGNTTETSAFVEANYFRECNRPMMISGQGTDAYNSSTGTYNLEGTFSGQDGGMTKAFNNIVVGTSKLVYQTQHATQFDAYLVTSRTQTIPNTVKSVRGGWTYSNFDTASTMYSYTPDAPGNVPNIVTTYSGRTQGGDFNWTFNTSTDDDNHDVNTALKSAIVGYQSNLVSVQDVTNPPASNQTLTSTTNNNQTVNSGTAISSIVFTWGGDATNATVTGLPASGISFIKNTSAKTITITGTPTATVSYSIATTGTGGSPATGSGTITVTPVSVQTLTSTSNNNQTVNSGSAISSIVFTWGGSATDATVTGLPASGISFVKNTTAKTITITGTPTATVSYSISTTGTGGMSVTGSGTITVNPVTPAGDQIHNFTTSGKTSAFYAISGDLSTNYGTVIYNGLTLTQCMKMGSGTNISYTTTQPSTLTLVFVESAGTTKVDGIAYTAVGGIITINNLPAGNHTVLKQNVANLFYISTKYNTTSRIKQSVKEGENNVAIGFVLYPNPVIETLYLSGSNQKIEKVAIYNMTGTLVKISGNNTESIDMSNLSSGSYLVKGYTDEGNFDKIIIKK